MVEMNPATDSGVQKCRVMKDRGESGLVVSYSGTLRVEKQDQSAKILGSTAMSSLEKRKTETEIDEMFTAGIITCFVQLTLSEDGFFFTPYLWPSIGIVINDDYVTQSIHRFSSTF